MDPRINYCHEICNRINGLLFSGPTTVKDMPKAQHPSAAKRPLGQVSRRHACIQSVVRIPYQVSLPKRGSLSSHRVFHVDIKTCSKRGCTFKVIACIQDPAVIDKTLTHLQEKVVPGPNDLLPQSRAPPACLFD